MGPPRRGIPCPGRPLSALRARSALPALLLVDLFEIGIDHLVVAPGLALTRLRTGAGSSARLRSRRALGLVHGLADLLGGLQERLRLGFDRVQVVTLGHGLEIGDRGLNSLTLVRWHFLAAVLERFLGHMDRGFAVVLGVDQLAALLVLFGMRLSV